MLFCCFIVRYDIFRPHDPTRAADAPPLVYKIVVFGWFDRYSSLFDVDSMLIYLAAVRYDTISKVF
jgi:hypothetical protein